MLRSFLLLLFSLSAGFSFASVPLFEGTEPVKFTLQFPIDALKDQRGEDPEYLDGMAFLDGKPIELRVKARGNFRRLRTSCGFPPYWINFKRKQVRDTVFDGVNKIKVVSHCREGWRSIEPQIMKEYLAYQTYRLVTDKSFRVRLAEITYIDSESGKESLTAMAFFIEPVEVLEDRLKFNQLNDRYILPSLYEQTDLALAEFFQFFAANSDFSFFASQDECCHNGKVFASRKGSEGLIPVPYDFDLSGIVNAPYATVAPNMPIKRVTQRFYRGTQKTQEMFDATIQHYLDREEAIMNLWQNTDLLEGKQKQAAIKFVAGFFDVLKNEELLSREIIQRTRNPMAIETSIVKKWTSWPPPNSISRTPDQHQCRLSPGPGTPPVRLQSG